jgi:DNA invertase Pin-like site-specific DNA recombinase
MSSTSQNLRCAVYTRKSTDDGLEQEFNSLDAQFEASAAFISSQKSLGWSLVPTRYDDGGVSGGTMERPALKRLLDDIRHGTVDVVVVYKIDRLTRSLMDFSKIVEIFEKRSVSFVSVTQQFNTTSSMGRLMLNVLLSFAQFEREVTAERIRDKIAASKKKGMWTGGPVPLGYRVVDKKLVIDLESAAFLKAIFKRYLELRSVVLLSQELSSKRQETMAPTRSFNRGMLHNMLANPIYLGKIRHRDQVYDGEHEAIVDPDLFQRVQDCLAEQAPDRKRLKNARDIHLLTGLAFDEHGDRLSPAHTSRHGKRYRYYASWRRKMGIGPRPKDGWRLPAKVVDDIAFDELRALLDDPNQIATCVGSDAPTEDLADLLRQATHMHAALGERRHVELRYRWLRIAFDRIEFTPGKVIFVVNRQRLAAELLAAARPGRVSHSAGMAIPPITIARMIALRRQASETKLIIRGSGAVTEDAKASVLNAIAKAHAFLAALTDGSNATIHAVAKRFGVNRADVSRILPAAFLAPSLTEMLLKGSQPDGLTAKVLLRDIDLPIAWTEQIDLFNKMATAPV